jgi:hypothetical protein
MTQPRLVCLIFSILVTYSSFAQSQLGVASEIQEIVIQYNEDVRALQRKYELIFSDEYYQRFGKLYTDWELSLSKIDIETLSLQGKADLILLKNQIAKEKYFLQKDILSFNKIKHVLVITAPIEEFIKKRRSGALPDYQSLAKSFHEINDKLVGIQSSLSQKPFENWMDADKAKLAIESLRANLEEAYGFYLGYDPLFTWWMEKPYEALNKGLLAYSEFLGKNYSTATIKDDGSGIIGKPIGRQAIEESLKFSFIPYSPEELIAAAERQFKYCESEMLKASAELGFGKDWQAAMEFVKNTYVQPGRQPQLINTLAQEAIDFVESRDLITVPDLAKETWRMIMMTPERQLINPFFTGGEIISISYPTNTMEHDEKMMSMRGNNPNFSTATVHHELIPGHHLQQYMTSRYKPYRQVFENPFWGEGWALYWEINLWNKGFADTPEERIGMLFWRMHRCARIIFSLSYHLEKLTPQQCIDLLVNRVGHEYANAAAEVRRSFTSGYDPLYQIAYMVGGLQFNALQKEMLQAGWTEKQYHDAVLRQGPIPVEILRTLLLEGNFDDHFSTKWRFSTDFK